MSQRELSPSDYIYMFRRHWVLILALALAGGPAGYLISRLLPSRYMSQTTVLVQQPTVSVDLVKPVVTSALNQQLTSMKTKILSRASLEPIIRERGLYAKEINRKPMEDLVARLQAAIDVEAVKQMAETSAQGLPGFTITVTLDDPQAAQAVCSTITSMFIKDELTGRQQDSQDTTEFFSQHLAESRKKLDDQDAKLAAFKSKYMGSLPDDEQMNSNLLASLINRQGSVTQALGMAQQDKAWHQSELDQQRAAWQISQTAGNPQTQEQQLVALQADLTNLQGQGYTDQFPDVIEKKNEIAALKKKIADSEKESTAPNTDKNPKSAVESLPIQQLRNLVHNDELAIAEKTKEQEQIKQQIAQYEGRMKLSPLVEQQYIELTRGYDTAKDAYNDLLKKQGTSAMATDLEKQQEGETFSILDSANLPDKPSFPNRPAFAAGGFFFGLALGLGLAFVIEIRDTSLRTERDVELLLHLPVLALIPPVEPLSGRRSKAAIAPTAGGLELGART